MEPTRPMNPANQSLSQTNTNGVTNTQGKQNMNAKDQMIRAFSPVPSTDTTMTAPFKASLTSDTYAMDVNVNEGTASTSTGQSSAIARTISLQVPSEGPEGPCPSGMHARFPDGTFFDVGKCATYNAIKIAVAHKLKIFILDFVIRPVPKDSLLVDVVLVADQVYDREKYKKVLRVHARLHDYESIRRIRRRIMDEQEEIEKSRAPEQKKTVQQMRTAVMDNTDKIIGEAMLEEIKQAPHGRARSERSAKQTYTSVSVLVVYGQAPVNFVDRESGKTALLWVIERNQLDLVSLVLRFMELDVNVKDLEGRSALRLAVESNNVKCVDMLLRRSRLNLDDPDLDGITTMVYANEHKRMSVVQMLLNAPHPVRSSLNIARADVYGRSPLSYASERGDLDMVDQLLKKLNLLQGVLAVDNVGKTCLMYACENGHKPVVKRLLKSIKSASTDVVLEHVNLECERGYNCLHLAQQGGFPEVEKKIIKAGGKVGKDVPRTTSLLDFGHLGRLASSTKKDSGEFVIKKAKSLFCVSSFKNYFQI